MIISLKNKYLFIELPRTGTTSISKTLIENYDGKEILKKHSRYSHFKRIAKPEQLDYYTFSCIRNPLDRVYSFYNKLKSDHEGQFSNFKYSRFKKLSSFYFYRQYNFIKKKDASFEEYFLKFYRIPYDDWASLEHKRFNKLLHFEKLEYDFLETLKEIGIEPKEKLPHINQTLKKNNYLYGYSNEKVISRAKKIFGFYMKEFGYSFPKNWGEINLSIWMKFNYKFWHFFRMIYWNYLKKS